MDIKSEIDKHILYDPREKLMPDNLEIAKIKYNNLWEMIEWSEVRDENITDWLISTQNENKELYESFCNHFDGMIRSKIGGEL